MTTIGSGGRTTEELAQSVRGMIQSGDIRVGDLLPSVRKLSEQFGVGSKTAHRALKSLASRGLISAEPSRGYRVLPKANDPLANAPMAYVLDTPDHPERWDEQHRRILNALQSASHARGWSLLTISSRDLSPDEVVDQLRTARAFGVALDLSDRQIVEQISAAGIPAVLVDCALDDVPADVLIQDGQHGGRLAVEHLHALGCRKIAWIGQTQATSHSRDRLSGALLGMHATGSQTFSTDHLLDLDPIATTDGDECFRSAIRMLLSSPNRPDGVVVLWMRLGHLVKEVADELGLVLDDDLKLVCWSMEEFYDARYVPGFNGAAVPAAITWSADTMAETALARLAERRSNPDLPFLRIKIPTRLRVYHEK